MNQQILMAFAYRWVGCPAPSEWPFPCETIRTTWLGRTRVTYFCLLAKAGVRRKYLRLMERNHMDWNRGAVRRPRMELWHRRVED